MVRCGVAWVKLDRSLEFLLSPVPVPLPFFQDVSERCMSFGKLRIDFQGLASVQLCPFIRVGPLNDSDTVVWIKRIAIRKPDVGKCVTRILLNGELEIANGLLQTLLSPLPPFKSPPQEKIICS